jgi:type IX secretion system PorP/SprF family membrane protein
MKRIYSGICLMFVMCAAYAQQRPHYTQYIMNNYIVNPAISGIENYVDVKAAIRNQWVGIPGAPQTFYLTVHGPIGKKDFKGTATSYELKGENSRGKQYWEDYTASEPHHGIGLQVVNYKTGYINRFYSAATYAYHIGINESTNLAAGFGAGFSSTNIDRSKIELANPIDPAIGNGTSEVRRVTPELNAGIWLYSRDYFVGLSAQQIIPSKVSLTSQQYRNSSLVPHLFATAGYRFFINDDVTALPSVMARYISSMPLYVDMNMKLQYRDRIWLGGSVRLKEGFAGMAGANISQTFNVSYSYDFNNASYLLQSMQRGTHEIVFGFLLNNGYGDMCPRNVW